MFQEITECARAAALKAGEILRNGFGSSFEISSKEGRNNLVTEFDKRSEEFIIDYLSKSFPGSSFLAEESGKTGERQSGKIRWIIDPLDGTVNFAHAIPIFSISIAAEIDNEIQSGVVYHPMLNELFVAEKGKGAFMNDRKIKVSENKEFLSSFLVTGFPYDIKENPCDCINVFVDIIKNGIPIRRLGSAALDLAYVACGRFDAFYEIGLKPWDVAAGILMVKEAGGKVTQFSGIDYNLKSRTMISSNAALHQELIGILKECNNFGEDGCL